MALNMFVSSRFGAVRACLLLLGLVGLAAASGASPVQTGRRQLSQSKTKLTCAKSGPFPYIVSLRNSLNNHFCGGVLVSQTTVVTAASCVDGVSIPAGDPMPTLYIGGFNIFEPIEVRATDEVYRHPSWDGITRNGHDIAIIKMKNPTCIEAIPAIGGPVTPGRDITFLGFGRTGDTKPFSDKLLFGQFKPQPAITCNHFVSPPYGAFCGKSPSNTGGLCEGDFGGPVIHTPTKRIFSDQLVGIASYVSGTARCEDPTTFAVFTSINHFSTWITSML